MMPDTDFDGPCPNGPDSTNLMHPEYSLEVSRPEVSLEVSRCAAVLFSETGNSPCHLPVPPPGLLLPPVDVEATARRPSGTPEADAAGSSLAVPKSSQPRCSGSRQPSILIESLCESSAFGLSLHPEDLRCKTSSFQLEPDPVSPFCPPATDLMSPHSGETRRPVGAPPKPPKRDLPSPDLSDVRTSTPPPEESAMPRTRTASRFFKSPSQLQQTTRSFLLGSSSSGALSPAPEGSGNSKRPTTPMPLTKTLSGVALLAPEPKEPEPEEAAHPNTSTHVHVAELYHWCATASVLLVAQLAAGAWQHRFRSLPPLSELGSLLLLLYCVGAAATLRFARGAQRWAPVLLAAGSVLMTGQLSWHWGSHMLPIREGLLLQQPCLGNVSLCAGAAPVDPAPSAPFLALAFGSSGLDFLDTATLLVILFLHCVQSTYLCSLGVWATAGVSALQWLVLACWPVVAPGVHPAWLCRLVAPGLWTVHLVRSSHVREVAQAHEARLRADLERAVLDSRKDLQDGQSADSVLNHMLKNTMADASGCIDLFCQQVDPPSLSHPAERTSTQVTRRANRKKRLTVHYIVEHPNQEGDTCIDWTLDFAVLLD